MPSPRQLCEGREELRQQKADPLAVLEGVRQLYLEGFGGLGLTTPVVSYAPRPIFISVSRACDIMDVVVVSGQKDQAVSSLKVLKRSVEGREDEKEVWKNRWDVYIFETRPDCLLRCFDSQGCVNEGRSVPQ